MAKKSVKKKSKKKVAKLTAEEKEEKKMEGELPKKSIRQKENTQLIWFFVVIAVVFASFLIPYFWVESSKVFDYGGAEWAIEEYENLIIYHGRFISFGNTELTYNLYLREDPRENDVPVEGELNKFKYGGIVSISPEVDVCRGEASRALFDLSAYLRQGIGLEELESATTDKFVSLDEDRRYAVCDNVNDRTLVVVEVGESKVVQDDDNPYCYTIYIEDCEDIRSIEKFMSQSLEDFNEVRVSQSE